MSVSSLSCRRIYIQRVNEFSKLLVVVSRCSVEMWTTPSSIVLHAGMDAALIVVRVWKLEFDLTRI